MLTRCFFVFVVKTFVPHPHATLGTNSREWSGVEARPKPGNRPVSYPLSTENNCTWARVFSCNLKHYVMWCVRNDLSDENQPLEARPNEHWNLYLVVVSTLGDVCCGTRNCAAWLSLKHLSSTMDAMQRIRTSWMQQQRQTSDSWHFSSISDISVLWGEKSSPFFISVW